MGSSVHVVAFQEGNWWVAQCLEYDIAAQAKTLPYLYYEVERLIVGHYAVATERGQAPFTDLPAAPMRYWQLFERAKLRLTRDPAPFRLPTPWPEPLPTPELRIAEMV